MGYERHSPTSKTKVSDETKAKVSDILYGFSNSSSSTISLGGGPIETTRDFYKKSQISDLCFCVLRKLGDLVQRRYYNYLSENLSHDSLFDSLPKKLNLSYLMENHGKSDLDGHFAILLRWFKEVERNRYMSSIEDLVSASKDKIMLFGNILDNSRVYHFQIYRKDAIRGLRIRAKVSSGFRNYLSFYLCDGGLIACPLSLPDPSKYFNIDFRIKVKRDIRTNKYAPDRSNPLGSDTDIMRSTSRNTQRTRTEMLRGIGVSQYLGCTLTLDRRCICC
ncbi:hypothetical protein BB560_005468 [Smittium megazygosporum]|uniref:Uncharacterized protein n=1 Tax=Smittium megazygosporum TaxID=133381 RepID=A0A2T9Z559_9FUNG|nr:hypothetical protein BB560_005468 [Smittium megazygosporum]